MRTFAATALALSLLVWTISGDAQSVQRGYEAALQGDFETAFQEWYPLAEQGDAIAQSNLAAMYATGQGACRITLRPSSGIV